MILPYGHEVGSHGLSHKVEEAFDILSLENQRKHLVTSKKILEDITGHEIISFRAPALRVNKNTPLALAESGFKIDSSIASQRFDMFLSFGGFKKLRWLTAPRLPYRTRANNLFRKGNGPVIEVPLSALFHPYVGTTLRILPNISRLARNILHLESRINFKPIVFDIHPNEFLDEHNGEMDKVRVARRTKNVISYYLKDVIRRNLKIKNLGRVAVPIYTREIEFFKSHEYQFSTLKDYVLNNGFEL
jgi:peptidoglycan/xylan/chitin deacetylase (PgdA/CDA1 family)